MFLLNKRSGNFKIGYSSKYESGYSSNFFFFLELTIEVNSLDEQNYKNAYHAIPLWSFSIVYKMIGDFYCMTYLWKFMKMPKLWGYINIRLHNCIEDRSTLCRVKTPNIALLVWGYESCDTLKIFITIEDMREG